MNRPRHCPAAGCRAPLPPGQVMCRLHWCMVPRPLQAAYWQAWRARDPQAVQAAHAGVIRAVTAKINGYARSHR